MNTDSDVSMLPNNQYRFGQDVRIITDDSGTSGVLQSVEGAKKYNYGIKGTEEIIGTATINDIAVVITKLVDGYNKVYRIENFDSPNLVSTVVLQGKLRLCEEANSNQLSIVLNYETQSNIRAYFTDGKSSIKVINIMSDKYVKYPNEDNPLVDSEGNILNPDSIDIIPNAILPPFEITDIVSGNFQAGMVQYCYRLYNPHSQQTSISSLSDCVHLDASSIRASLINHYGSQKDSYTGKGCTIQAPLSTKDFSRCTIIRIFYKDNNSIPSYTITDDIEIDTDKDTISYTDTGSNQLSVLTQEEFNALTSYAFICNSITSVQNRLFASNITETSWVPMIEDNGNLVEYDARAYRANKDGSVRIETSDPNDYMYFGIEDYDTMRKVPMYHDCINPYNAKRDIQGQLTILPYVYGKNEQLGGNGLNIEYDFIYTELNEDYISILNGGLRNNVGISNTSERIESVVIFHVDPTDTFFNKQVAVATKQIKPVTGQKNYANPIISALFRSYQRDEVYRFGIVFYNSKSIASPVLWIGDIRFPNLATFPAFVQDVGKNTFQSLPIGVRFTVKNFPIDAVSYEIVRCDRTEQDKTIVSQGVITPLHNYKIVEDRENGEVGRGTSKDTNEYRPMPFLMNKRRGIEMGLDGSDRKRTSTIDNNDIASGYWRFISPEVCFNGEKAEEVFKDNIYIKQEGLIHSYFSTAEVNTTTGVNVQNWVGMNNKSVYPPNSTTVDSSKYREWTKVNNKDDSQSENAIQVFNIHRDDFCGAYIQKFYSKGSSIYNSAEQTIADAKLAKIYRTM